MRADRRGVPGPARVGRRGLGGGTAHPQPVDPAAGQPEQGRDQGQRAQRADRDADGRGHAEGAEEADPRGVQAEHGDDHGDRGDQHGPAAGGHGPAGRLRRVGAVDDLLPVPGGQEQGVVDADAQAHHHGQRGRDARERERGGGHPEHPQRGGHAEHGGEDGQPGGEHAAEPEQQDHDGHQDADQLGSAVLGRGPGRLAERAAVADADARRPRRGHRVVDPADVAGAEGGRVLAEVDHVVGGPPVPRRGGRRQRVTRGQHVREGPDVRDRVLDRAAVAGQGARADREHQLAAQSARLRLVLLQQCRSGLGRRAGQRKIIGVGPAERAVAERHPGQQDHPDGHDQPGMPGTPAAETTEPAEHDVVVAVSRGRIAGPADRARLPRLTRPVPGARRPGPGPGTRLGGRVRARRICHDCHYVKNCQS